MLVALAASRHAGSPESLAYLEVLILFGSWDPLHQEAGGSLECNILEKLQLRGSSQPVSTSGSGKGDVAQLVVGLPSVHEALGSIPSTP